MPERCTVCAHPDVQRIDDRLRQRPPIVGLAKEFQVTRDSMTRHRDRHADIPPIELPSEPVPRTVTGKRRSAPPKTGRKGPPPANARELFLEEFRKTGNVTSSAEAAHVERTSIFRWQEMDNAFALAFQQAEIEAVERLEAEARERAVKGSKLIRRVTRNGRLIEEIEEWRPSDAMLIKLLQALRPEKYGDKLSVTSTTIVKTVDSTAWEAV
jgi:hypothetical protein